MFVCSNDAELLNYTVSVIELTSPAFMIQIQKSRLLDRISYFLDSEFSMKR